MKTNENITIFHIVENYLSKHYDLKFNSISLQIEISIKTKNEWEVLNENDIWLELQKKKIKISMSSFIAILKSNYIQNYNPIKDYFETLSKWDGKTDFVKKYSEYIILDEEENKSQFEYHFKKWCVRAVKCVLIDDYFNKQAFVITDNGFGQNIGKTSWCRFLCPPILSNYIAQDIPENEKDARILFAKNFLVNLDELSSLSKKEINKLKSYFSLDKINDRLPYDKKNSIIPRIASFIGSTNMSTFLQDETGSVRWLCFVVKSINWNYKKEFNIDDLWSQVYHLANDCNFVETMTSEDLKINELRNEKFQIITSEIELLRKYFYVTNDIHESTHFTATDILNKLNLVTFGIRLNPVSIGRAIKVLGFKREKYKNVYGYWLVYKEN